MIAELAENAPVYSSFPLINNYPIKRDFMIAFGCGKYKNGNLVVPSSELYLVFDEFT